MRIWFMRIFARPKKTHEPRTRCIFLKYVNKRQIQIVKPEVVKSSWNIKRLWSKDKTWKIEAHNNIIKSIKILIFCFLFAMGNYLFLLSLIIPKPKWYQAAVITSNAMTSSLCPEGAENIPLGFQESDLCF